MSYKTMNLTRQILKLESIESGIELAVTDPYV